MGEDPNAIFRERLKALRRAAGITQERFAEVAGLNYKHYQEIERGGKQEIRFTTLVKIAAAYGIPLQHLFSDTSPRLILSEDPPAGSAYSKPSKAAKTCRPRKK